MNTPEDRNQREILVRQKSERLSRRSSSFLLTDDLKQREQMDKIGPRKCGIQSEASSKGVVKGSLIYNYFKAGIHWPQIVILVFSFLFVQLIASTVDYFVSIWTSQERLRATNSSSSAVLSTKSCIFIQTALLAALLIFIVARTIGFYATIIRVARKIHFTMFNGIILTAMRFFDTNPSGRILNRFSRDLR